MDRRPPAGRYPSRVDLAWRRIAVSNPGGKAERLRFPALVCAIALTAGAAVSRGGLTVDVVIALFGVVVAGILFARRLDTVLMAWVAVEGIAYPFVRYPLHHNVASLDRFVVAAMGAALLYTASPRMSREARVLCGAFGLFACAYGLRAFFTTPLPPPRFYPAVSPYQARADWLDQVALPFIVLVVAAQVLHTHGRWSAMTRVLSFLGATVALLGLGQWVTGFDLSTFSGGAPFIDRLAGAVRVSGPYQDPTSYGSVLVICLVATIYWLQEEGASPLAAAVLVLEIVGLAPSLTKTVWVAGFVAGVIAFGVRRRVNSRTVIVALYGVCVLGVVYSLLQSSPVVAERVTGSNQNVLTRFGDYVQGVLIFEHWPLTGAGIQQFIPAQNLVPLVSIGGVPAGPSAHNTFISVLAETGVLGFVPLMVLVYVVIKLVREVRRRAETEEEVRFASTVLAAVVGYFLLSLTLVQIYYPVATMLLAVVLGAAAARLRGGGAEPGPASPPGIGRGVVGGRPAAARSGVAAEHGT